MREYHTSVLLDEAVSTLIHFAPPNAVFVDGTLGGGGHTHEILSRTKDARVIGIDRDQEALTESACRLSAFQDRFVPLHGNHEDMPALLKSIGVDKVQGILLDLGVSSYQFDEAARGFSYNEEAALDMRMDRQQAFTCHTLVNEWPEKEIARVLREYGEEAYAGRIARKIIEARPVETTTQLAEIIKQGIPAAKRRTGPHPARRSFQALRIAVNGELTGLGDALEQMVDLLVPGGRICVITFHSLEDRIVKTRFNRMANPCTCPPKAPICICGKEPVVQLVHRKPISPSEAEVEENPRSRSAHLRTAERIMPKESQNCTITT